MTSHAEHHIVPVKTLVAVILALASLTVLTVIASQINLGSFNVPIALVIAAIKSSLVIAIFMGLKYDNRTNALILAVGFVMVMVFLVFVLLDTSFRGDTSATRAGTITDTERVEAPSH